MLWRPPLGDLAPESATLADGGCAELLYPERREIRAWPSFELLETASAEGAGPPGSAQAEEGLAAARHAPEHHAAGPAWPAQGRGSVGRHLKILREACLIQGRRSGRPVLYYRTAAGDLVDAQPGR